MNIGNDSLIIDEDSLESDLKSDDENPTAVVQEDVAKNKKNDGSPGNVNEKTYKDIEKPETDQMEIEINNIESPNTEVEMDEQRSDSGKSLCKENIKFSDKFVESLQPEYAEKPGKFPDENAISVSNESEVKNTETVSKHPELAQNVVKISSERQNPDKTSNSVKASETEKLQIKISTTSDVEPITSQNNNSNKKKPVKEHDAEVKESTETAAEKSEIYNPSEDPNALENFKVEWEEPVTDSETGSDSDEEVEEVPESGEILSQESALEKNQTNEVIMYGMIESFDENEIVFHCSTCQDLSSSPLKKVGFLKIDHLLTHYKCAHGKTDTNKSRF